MELWTKLKKSSILLIRTGDSVLFSISFKVSKMILKKITENTNLAILREN